MNQILFLESNQIGIGGEFCTMSILLFQWKLPKSIHSSWAIFLAIWHHKKLLYLFYLLILQIIQ